MSEGKPGDLKYTVVFETPDGMEARLVAGWLNAHRVEADVFDFTPLHTESHWMARPSQVIVAPASVEAVHALLGPMLERSQAGRLSLAEVLTGELSMASDDDEAQPSASTTEGLDAATCPACGEAWEPGFDVCWNCLHEPETP